jgi:hypothetical protein
MRSRRPSRARVETISTTNEGGSRTSEARPEGLQLPGK